MSLVARALAWSVRLATGVRSGALPHWRPGSVFFANHSSHLDSLVIWAALPHAIREKTSPVAATDYWEKTAPRRWLAKRIFNAILLDRHGRPADRSHPLAKVSAALDEGRSLIIFPEGTRSADGKMSEFKAGLHYLRKCHPESLFFPVSLDNLSRILPKGVLLPVPVIGRIVVHEAMAEVADESRESFLKRAEEAVASGVQDWEDHD